MKLLFATMLTVVYSLHCLAQGKGLRIVFRPESDQFSGAAHEYEAIWGREGQRITAAMEAVSGLRFEDREVKAMVLEIASSSGYKDQPMRLRASYPLETKKATLIHELG